MKRSVRYQLNFASKWLTLSGVMMGIAFFVQALNYLAFRQLGDISVRQLLLFLILPMSLEALWCVPLRSELWKCVEVHGIFAALVCIVLLGQAIFVGGVLPIILAVVFYLVGAASAILLTWGFIPHRALGILIFTGTFLMWALTFALPAYLAAPGYMVLLDLIPTGCLILSTLLLFGGIRMRVD